jgi:hypothetical protein
MFAYLVLVAAALCGLIHASLWTIPITSALVFLSPITTPDKTLLLTKLPRSHALQLHAGRILTSIVAAAASYFLGVVTAWLFPL